MLANKLKSLNYSVLATREPTDTVIGKLARSSEQSYTDKTLACLFAADRHQHCKILREKLADGYIVLCDRYIISGLVLQNMDGVDFNYVMALNEGFIPPDLQIVLYADSKVIEKRLKDRVATRLARQERIENYDRYRQHKAELEKHVGRITYMPSNSISDAESIANYILQQLKCREDIK